MAPDSRVPRVRRRSIANVLCIRNNYAHFQSPAPLTCVVNFCRDARHGEVAGDPPARASFAQGSEWCLYSDSTSRKDWYAAFKKVEEQQPVLFKQSDMLLPLPKSDDGDLIPSLVRSCEKGLGDARVA